MAANLGTKEKCTGRRYASWLHWLAITGLALLFALQPSIVSAVPGHFAHGDAGASVGSILGVPCASQQNEGKGRPAQDGDHAQCCLLCETRDSDPAPVTVLDTSFKISIPRSFPSVSPAWRGLGAKDGAPVGWVSSWSSRAPPSFF